MGKRLLMTMQLCLLLSAGSSWAQTHKSDSLVVYYAEGKTDIDPNLLDNRKNIFAFIKRYDSMRQNHHITVSSMKFDAYASSTSTILVNQRVAQRRAQKLFAYLRSNIDLPENVVEVTSHEVDWQGLRRQVEASDMPHKYEVLCILMLPPKKVNDRRGRRVDQRKLKLLGLYGGRTWKYLYDHFFQSMRYASVTIKYELECKPIQLPKVVPKEPWQTDSLRINQALPLGYPRNGILPRDSMPQYVLRQYFALKTNLLFDALSALNVEVEVPVAKHWSVMGEYMFPWWLYGYKRNCWWMWSHGQNCLEIISGTLEGRYWLGTPGYPRQPYTPQTGWFLGAFGGGGYYDLERKGKGYQGEFLMAGVSGGYVAPLGKSRQWLLECSMSAGFLHTGYRYYEAIWSQLDARYHLLRQHDATTSWLGPLKAKVSLVWYPFFRKRLKPVNAGREDKKGGGR